MIARTAYNTRELEESLAARGVPYTVEGGSSFFSRPEVQAPLALLALCANPQVTTYVMITFSTVNDDLCSCLGRPRRRTGMCRLGLSRLCPFEVPVLLTKIFRCWRGSACCSNCSVNGWMWSRLKLPAFPVNLSVPFVSYPLLFSLEKDDAAFRRFVSLRSRTRLLHWATPAAMRGIGELAVAEGVSYAEGVRLSVSRGLVQEEEASAFIYGLRR